MALTISSSSSLYSHSSPILSLSLSQSLLASSSEDRTICLWSPDERHTPVFVLFSPEPCLTLKIGINNPERLYCTYSGKVIYWDLRNTRRSVDVWKVAQSDINSLDFLETEDRLATADDGGTVSILSANTGSIYRTMRKHDSACLVVKFRPDRTWQIMSGGLDSRLYVTDWRGSGRGAMIFEMEDFIYNSICASPLQSMDDGFLDSDSELDDYAEVASSFSSQNTSSVSVIVVGDEIPPVSPMIHSLACTANGNHVALGLETASVELFRGDGKYLKHFDSLQGHTRSISALHCIQNTHLISGSNDRSLILWDLTTTDSVMQILHTEKIIDIEGHHLSRVYVADFTPNIQIMDLSTA